MFQWGEDEAKGKRVIGALSGPMLLLAALAPAAPVEAQDLFCGYGPSILVQTDFGPVLIHLLFRTSRLIDARAVEGLIDET